MTTGIISGVISALLMFLIEVLLRWRKRKMKENILIEKENPLGKSFNQWIEEKAHDNKIGYYEVFSELDFNINYTNDSSKCLIGSDDYTLIKGKNTDLYNVRIIELIINEEFDQSKIRSQENVFLLENKEYLYEIEKLQYDSALFINLNYPNIPQFKIAWEDEYGYEGEFILSDNNFNHIMYSNMYIYNNNSFIKELKETLSISKYK